jgi:UDP-GlcNAc3NAcA epimerase
MFDSVRRASSLAMAHSRILERLGLAAREYGVVTFHRQENLEHRERLEAIVSYLRGQAESIPLILPLHPRTQQALDRAGISIDAKNITQIEPIGYLDMCRLVGSAAIVLTDSGGLQREAYFHHVPCITLRDETEWTETVESGWNRLWTDDNYRRRRHIPEYDKMDAADGIARILVREICDNKT